MEDRLNDKIKYLYEMLDKYDELDNEEDESKSDYSSKQNAIYDQLEVLEHVRDNEPNNEWDECYKEDLVESKRS